MKYHSVKLVCAISDYFVTTLSAQLNLEEGSLLAEIHREQVAHGFGNPAF